MTTISSQLQTAIAQNEKLSKELEVLVKEKIELSQKYQETENKVKQLEAQNKHLSSVLQQRPSLLLLQRNASDTPGITIFQQILMIALLATIIVLCSLIIPSRFFSRHLRAT
jgi:predicted nuclease with TOPRIM domain